VDISGPCFSMARWAGSRHAHRRSEIRQVAGEGSPVCSASPVRRVGGPSASRSFQDFALVLLAVEEQTQLVVAHEAEGVGQGAHEADDP